MSDQLRDLVSRPVFVFLTDGRSLVGNFEGYDQQANVILSQTHERIFSSTEPMQSVPIGVYLIRGETIALIGELDEELDEAADYDSMRVEPFEPIHLCTICKGSLGLIPPEIRQSMEGLKCL